MVESISLGALVALACPLAPLTGEFVTNMIGALTTTGAAVGIAAAATGAAGVGSTSAARLSASEDVNMLMDWTF